MKYTIGSTLFRLIFFGVVIANSLQAVINNDKTNGDPDPTVKTTCGEFRGKVLTGRTATCDAYMGVPFAAPPVKELRWKKPQPPTCSSEIRDAKEFAPACIQKGSNGTDPKDESEDCLYLNVFIPKSKTNDKLPVMVFIHGGAFEAGTARDFGDQGVCDNLASRGVIVVIIQYRLNMYGFFSTGDSAAAGNYGLWDQIEALKWVQKNIGAFGGDEKQVTIFGESAGGASVSYLTYTKMANDMFHRSIAESGSALSNWGTLVDTSVKTAKQLAHAAKCTDPDSEKYLTCLRQLSTVDLQKTLNTMIDPSVQYFFDQWGVRVDGEMFTQSRFEELDPHKPAVIGVNSMEMPAPETKDIPIAQLLLNKTLDGLFPGNGTVDKILKETARYVYIDSKGDRNNNTFVCQQASKITADVMFHVGPALEAASKTSAGSSVWVYNFDYYSKEFFPPDFPFEKGANHAHELCYLFRLYDSKDQYLKCPHQYDGDYGVVADHLGEMWTNFAKTGNPSPKGLEWPQFRNVTNANAMRIRTDLKIEQNFYLDVVNFWNFLKPNIEGSFRN